MSLEIPSRPFVPPRLAPLRARLFNALASRALPLDLPLDAGLEAPVVCRLSFNAAAASLEQEAPFVPAAALFLRSGEELWRLEWSSLEALALRPELADWRRAQPLEDQDFARLPQELCLAVLERLLIPALEGLENFLGCEVRCTAEPQPEAAWDGPLPLVLELPGNGPLFLRLFWGQASGARYLLERLEQLPLHTAAGPCCPGTAACPLEVGSMRLSVREVAGLVPGDVLLPESWAPEAPRLRLPRGQALACRLEQGIVSVLGPDQGDPGRECTGKEGGNGMSEEKLTSPGAMEARPATDAPLSGNAAVSALELPVVFEIGRLQLRLDELAALVPGHTFVLGGDTAVPVVDIRVAGQVLAQGRLVDVAGMPGVQITRMEAAGQDRCPRQEAGGSSGQDDATRQGAEDGTGRD